MSSPKVGILGGGQLGRMLVQAANDLEIQVTVLDAEHSPAKQISAHNGHITGSFKSRADVKALAQSCDVLTTEIEHVDTYALEEVAANVDIQPSWETLRIIQDKFEQRHFLQKWKIPMAQYWELREGTSHELTKIGEDLGYPLMLKSKTQAYDGRGNCPVKDQNDIPRALEALKDRPLYVEKWVKFKMEIAVIVVKTKDDVLSYPTVETVQEASICKLVYAPARTVTENVNIKAQELAKDVVKAFEGKGVFGVEMFLMEDDTLLLNELAPRVHNSGHWTIEGSSMSQFEAHLRAILDLPVPQPFQVRPSIMLNILGGSTPDFHLKVKDRALSIPGAKVHLYGKGEGRLGRKMGHITVTASTMYECEMLIQPLIDYTDGTNHHGTTEPRQLGPLPIPSPPIAVFMGSDSDLETLMPGLALLEDYFGITPLTQIVSAHRTPDHMAQVASSAARCGVKVIIAAAGGAAHLPGMMAAQTTLPVIGVPVKARTLDGVDSLYSIVQMPRGISFLSLLG